MDTLGKNGQLSRRKINFLQFYKAKVFDKDKLVLQYTEKLIREKNKNNKCGCKKDDNKVCTAHVSSHIKQDQKSDRNDSMAIINLYIFGTDYSSGF